VIVIAARRATAMQAGMCDHGCRPALRRFPFFLNVVTAISDEGPGMAVGHHVGPEVTRPSAQQIATCGHSGRGFGLQAVIDEGAPAVLSVRFIQALRCASPALIGQATA
jgi:hypothetical protein